MKEIWKDIDNYKGYYKVSNFGRINSLKNNIIRKLYNNKRGYQYINLSKNGETKTFTVHRLVASSFLKNPNKYKEINHKDFNGRNNHINNLEWCSRSQNIKHIYDNGRGEKMKKTSSERAIRKFSKKVAQYTKKAELKKIYNSVSDATRETGISHISEVCTGKRKFAGNYYWVYINI